MTSRTDRKTAKASSARTRYHRRRDQARCVDCNFQMDSDRYARCAPCRSKQASDYADAMIAGTRKRKRKMAVITSLNK